MACTNRRIVAAESSCSNQMEQRLKEQLPKMKKAHTIGGIPGMGEEPEWGGYPADIDPALTGVDDDEYTGGVYRCRDNIANLKVRVKVRRVNHSGPKVGLAKGQTSRSPRTEHVVHGGRKDTSYHDYDNDEDEQEGADEENPNSPPEVEEVVVGWQEKVFSPGEVRMYSEAKEEDFHSNVLKKKFFRDVQALGKKAQVKVKAAGSSNTGKASRCCHIFTLVDGELSSLNDENKSLLEGRVVNLTTNPDEEPNFLTMNMVEGLRRRKVSNPDSTDNNGGQNSNDSSNSSNNHYFANEGPVFDRSTIPTRNIVVEAPSREIKLKTRTLATVQQVMEIKMVLSRGSHDNDDDDGSDERSSVVVDLCVLKYGSNGVLEIVPDLTHGRRPYRFQMFGNGKQTYEFWLEHASNSIEYDDQLRESIMMKEVYARHAQIRRDEVGTEFDCPPDHTFRMLVLGEVVSAHGFQTYDLTSSVRLFVHYFTDLPAGWTVYRGDTDSGEGLLDGMTQTCRTSVLDGGKDVAHFSHTFTLDLRFDINRLDHQNRRQAAIKWPQIYFEVVSIDGWFRCRTEGYGHLPLPTDPGTYGEILVDTWRPIKTKPNTEMRRFFIGGTPELDDLSYCGIPASSADEPILSRYGLKTVTGGTVNLRLNILHQAKAFAVRNRAGEWDSSNARQSLLDRLSSATLMSSVATVLEAFHLARERVLKATEGFKITEE